jgi:YidC/Oxa1 family membrane protein insertase
VGALFSGIGVLFQAIFTQPIFNVLMLLYHLFGDFGLSIVVLTLIIKLVLFPLTLQQLKSAKANQALQPQMQELRRKYAKDQQALAVATQALYKEYGINPLAGCLPLLIQLPVLYGMYFAFSTVLRDPKEIPGLLYPFVQNFAHFTQGTLSGPHALSLTWFTWLKFLNPAWPWSISLAQPDPTYILPVIAAAATFVQLRMSLPKTAPASPSAKAAAPDPTASTMKTMQYVMPFFTLFIGVSLPSGLALYWTVSSIFQAVQQYFVTGWGSLLVTPNISLKKESDTAATSASSNGATASRKESVKEKPPVEDDEDGNKPVATATSGAVASKMRSTTGPRPSHNSSSSQSGNRRSRNSSASARRRNTQRPRR